MHGLKNNVAASASHRMLIAAEKTTS